jgi:hypothetical protein
MRNPNSFLTLIWFNDLRETSSVKSFRIFWIKSRVKKICDMNKFMRLLYTSWSLREGGNDRLAVQRKMVGGESCFKLDVSGLVIHDVHVVDFVVRLVDCRYPYMTVLVRYVLVCIFVHAEIWCRMRQVVQSCKKLNVTFTIIAMYSSFRASC